MTAFTNPRSWTLLCTLRHWELVHWAEGCKKAQDCLLYAAARGSVLTEKVCCGVPKLHAKLGRGIRLKAIDCATAPDCSSNSTSVFSATERLLRKRNNDSSVVKGLGTPSCFTYQRKTLYCPTD